MPRASLDTFAWEFRQGMAARAKTLGDVGDSSPENWEAPLGTPDIHVVLTAVAPDPRSWRRPSIGPGPRTTTFPV